MSDSLGKHFVLCYPLSTSTVIVKINLKSFELISHLILYSMLIASVMSLYVTLLHYALYLQASYAYSRTLLFYCIARMKQGRLHDFRIGWAILDNTIVVTLKWSTMIATGKFYKLATITNTNAFPRII